MPLFDETPHLPLLNSDPFTAPKVERATATGMIQETSGIVLVAQVCGWQMRKYVEKKIER